MEFVIRWLLLALAVAAAAHIPILGVSYTSVTALLVASLVLGLLNAVVKPILMLLSLPLILLTLGLFLLVINAAVLLLCDALVPGFDVAGFWSAMGASIFISLVTLLLNSVAKRATA